MDSKTDVSEQGVKNSASSNDVVEENAVKEEVLNQIPIPDPKQLTSDEKNASQMFWEKLEQQEKEKDYNISKTVLEEITREAFKLFDYEQNDTCKVSDLGYVVRSLGVNPSRAELDQITKEATKESTDTDTISLRKFQDVMVSILIINKMQRDSEKRIRKAFEVIDMEKKGYIEPDKLSSLLMTHGEAFSQEEVDSMLKSAVDTEKGVIFYKEYATLLAND